jgi:hypothetical protein
MLGLTSGLGSVIAWNDWQVSRRNDVPWLVWMIWLSDWAPNECVGILSWSWWLWSHLQFRVDAERNQQFGYMRVSATSPQSSKSIIRLQLPKIITRARLKIILPDKWLFSTFKCIQWFRELAVTLPPGPMRNPCCCQHMMHDPPHLPRIFPSMLTDFSLHAKQNLT